MARTRTDEPPADDTGDVAPATLDPPAEPFGEGVDQWAPDDPVDDTEGKVRVRTRVGLMGLAAGEEGHLDDTAELRACAERGLVDILE